MGAHMAADEDAKRYRDGYPGQEAQESKSDRANVEFYSNRRKSVPDGDFIDNIHSKWFGDYDKLEVHHGYIQWLFPIREPGMNMECQPLTIFEARELKASEEMRARLVKSYRLILDFYGMTLADEATGKVARKAVGWERQYENLNRSMHNYLRITRIIKCLGELGLEHYQAPWCEFFIQEVLVEKKLSNCARSLVEYWIPVVKDDAARQKLLKEAEQRFAQARR